MTGTVLTPTPAGRLFSRPAAVASCVGFVLIGMLQAPALHWWRGGRARLRRRAAGAAGFAPAPGRPLAPAAAFLGGLGFGGIDHGLSQLFAVGFGDRSTALLNA
ncbi:major facilitator superfamily MFS_1 [Streptomyces hygroscopicus subsp. jinggangensis 5008]|nr:major facilitator superfamily MFS_1 [Streptomyces hygroscopicus subsp. jinggangensis 5008]AGF66635.1 major facilitator superfamily MFS_1 [Streptomyces hygroscopicus subsp. jinggangensis TL01]